MDINNKVTLVFDEVTDVNAGRYMDWLFKNEGRK